MRAFTRIAAATVMAAGLSVAGAGAALASPSDEDARDYGVLDLLLGDFFAEDTSPPASAPAETSGQGTDTTM